MSWRLPSGKSNDSCTAGRPYGSLLRFVRPPQPNANLLRQQALATHRLATASSRTLEELVAAAIQESQDLRSCTVQQDPVPRIDRADECADFPTRLYAVLSSSQFEDSVGWMAHGYAWKIKDLNLFASRVLPVFVDSGSYPENFNRFAHLLTSFGFKQVTRGPDTSAYYHEVRNSTNTCVLITFICNFSF
jgi:hypothetical protein